MFNTEVKERKDIIISNLEYTKKKRYLANDELYKEKIDLIDRIINNDICTDDDFKLFISQLEYTCKKRLLDTWENNIVDNRRVEDIKTKLDKAIYIISNIIVNIIVK